MINILLLNWNSFEDIQICVEQIIKSDVNKYRIILIDNKSNEEEKNKLILFYKKLDREIDNEVYLIQNSDNLGYAGGNNEGYEYLKSNNLDGNILILNPDISLSENTIANLQTVLNEDSSVGACMCRTLNSDLKINYDYISMNGLSQKPLTTNLDLVETDYVAGSCMLLRRETIDKVGLFNDTFFMYWEEVDLSFRIRKLGYKLLSTTKTYIIRKENDKSRSINMNYYMTRNIFLMKKLHSEIKPYQVLIILLKMFKGSLSNTYKNKKIKYLYIFFKGVIDGYKIYKK